MKCIIYTLLFCIALIHTSCLAQQLRRIKIGYKVFPVNSIEFDVLKAEPNIKHGHYLRKNYSGAVVESGFYKNNLKDSIWVSRDVNLMPESEGMYKNEKRVGEWKFYFKGVLDQIYDYSTNQLVFKSNRKLRISSLIVKNGDTIQEAPEQPLTFIGGTDQFGKYIADEIKVPFEAKETNISGKIKVQFTVNENGDVDDAKALTKFDSGCIEEALRVIKSTSGKWIPAKQHEVNVTSVNVLSITFNPHGIVSL